MNGEHLWLETNVSGDLCYLGEENCQVRFAVSMSHGAHLVFRGNSGWRGWKESGSQIAQDGLGKAPSSWQRPSRLLLRFTASVSSFHSSRLSILMTLRLRWVGYTQRSVMLSATVVVRVLWEGIREEVNVDEGKSWWVLEW